MEWLLGLALLGIIVGFMAGLLGIGGGGIMVPVLTSIFLAQGIPVEQVVHIALGTSMASIIITAIVSSRTHHRHGAVIWPIVRQISPAIIIGAFAATFIAHAASSKVLAFFFCAFMSYVAIQMFFDLKPVNIHQQVSKSIMALAGFVIGIISALVSIGGGAMSVPFLCWQGVELKKAIATSAAIGIPIAISGTLGYLVNGFASTDIHQGYLGYIYLPAVLLICLFSAFTAPMGAKMAHRLPVPRLKKIFSLLLVLLSIKMLANFI